jgi:hypothetical protein
MSALIVSPGDRFEKLEIVREIERTNPGERRFELKCDCGNITTGKLKSLRCGDKGSCEACYPARQRASVTTHGRSYSAEYKAWSNALDRCFNIKNKFWHIYGGYGITVAPEWKQDFPAFLAYIGTRPLSLYSLDRWPDPHGSYEPGNVRWATKKEQVRNRRDNIMIRYQGEQRKMADVAEELGFIYQTILSRYRNGWSDADLFRPVNKRVMISNECTVTAR